MRISKTFAFDAAHQLPHHDGKCARLHGHTYSVTLVLDGPVQTEGPKRGMVFDYGDIKAAFKPLLDGYLDHHYLNETTGLENPTGELLAEWIGQRLIPSLPLLVAVSVSETCTTSATWERPK